MAGRLIIEENQVLYGTEIAGELLDSSELAIGGTATATEDLVTVGSAAFVPPVVADETHHIVARAIKAKAVGGPCYFAVADSDPDPTSEPRYHVNDGEMVWLRVVKPKKIGCIEDAT